MTSLRFDDTIVAVATPPGRSAIGVVRLSGPQAVEMADACFRGKRRLHDLKGYQAAYGRVVDTHGAVIDEVVALVFRAPRSYTGEDMVELSAHGSPYILQKMVERLVEAGARVAHPGEFTQRAFLHGKLDLAQAEAVADLIEAATEAQHHAAIHQMRGHFSDTIRRLRSQLVEVAALMELELDFAEEDVEFADRTHLTSLVRRITDHLTTLKHSYRWGQVIKEGVYVLIAGRPNVGKSTLLNTLLREERAIVSPTAGTTRDVIEDVRIHGGIIYRFFDTAGLRTTADTIEQIGIERMLQYAQKAHWILYLVDLTVENPADWRLPPQMQPWRDKVILIGNKTDLVEEAVVEAWKARFPEMLFITASEPAAADTVLDTLAEKVGLSHAPAGALVVNARHYEAIVKALTALHAVETKLAEDVPTDLVVFHLREALDHLGAITGDIVTDDILTHIFSRFCIGK